MSSLEGLNLHFKVRKDTSQYNILDIVVDDEYVVSRTILYPTQKTNGHSHSWEEVYVFTKGKASMVIGSKVRTISLIHFSQRYETVLVPANVFHQVKNLASSHPVEFFCIWNAKEGVK
jgi:mannose-6-phosphate isomerase-like protein (cupin superfamily)